MVFGLLHTTHILGGKLPEELTRETVIYDIGAAEWYPAGSMCADRASMAATASPSGSFALFAGGEGVNKSKVQDLHVPDTAVLLDA